MAKPDLIEVKDLKLLSCPQEGGHKKDWDAFLNKIFVHVGGYWEKGHDVARILRHETPDIGPSPPNLTDDEKKDDSKVRAFNKKSDKFEERADVLEANKTSLYFLNLLHISEIAKGKLKGLQGYKQAERDSDPIWLVASLEDLMTDFETATKSPAMALHDQMDRIMSAVRETNETVPEYVSRMLKEVNTYERHGGDFLWAKHMEENLADEMNRVKQDYFRAHNSNMDAATKKAEYIRRKKLIKQQMRH